MASNFELNSFALFFILLIVTSISFLNFDSLWSYLAFASSTFPFSYVMTLATSFILDLWIYKFGLRLSSSKINNCFISFPSSMISSRLSTAILTAFVKSTKVWSFGMMFMDYNSFFVFLEVKWHLSLRCDGSKVKRFESDYPGMWIICFLRIEKSNFKIPTHLSGRCYISSWSSFHSLTNWLNSKAVLYWRMSSIFSRLRCLEKILKNFIKLFSSFTTCWYSFSKYS